MSQKVDQRAPGSEDIFSTEELLLGQDEFPGYTETAAEEPKGSESMDSEDKIDPVLEDQGLEAMDEIIDTEETNEDDLEVESSEMTEGQDTEVDGTSSKPAKKLNNPDKLTELPLSKVKHIIKLDPEVNLVNADAVFLITKATESFVRTLGKESFNFAVQQKKKTITKKDVDSALSMLPIEL